LPQLILNGLHMSSTPSQIASNFAQTAASLSAIAKAFHARGWLLGTSGNLSAVVSRDPLRLAMSPSGIDKGDLTAAQVLLVDEQAQVLSDHRGKPSDETLLHLRIVNDRHAGAVLHTHSVWNTILSVLYAADGGINIEGYEMLKGLAGIRTHEHSEWLPIIENSQDMTALASSIGETLLNNSQAHGLLLRRHGLYSWGTNLHEAKRHIEILEFLLETIGRTLELKGLRLGAQASSPAGND